MQSFQEIDGIIPLTSVASDLCVINRLLAYRLPSGRTQASRSATGMGELIYSRAMTKVLAELVSNGKYCVDRQVPKWDNMRLKMARAVDGCLYNLLKVVPGRPSRYSNDRRAEADILYER